VAAKVRQHGKGFEDVLKEREKDNVKFSFMFKEEVRAEESQFD
jgi:U2-associated protein SR140